MPFLLSPLCHKNSPARSDKGSFSVSHGAWPDPPEKHKSKEQRSQPPSTAALLSNWYYNSGSCFKVPCLIVLDMELAFFTAFEHGVCFHQAIHHNSQTSLLVTHLQTALHQCICKFRIFYYVKIDQRRKQF